MSEAANYIRQIAGSPEARLILAKVDAVNGRTCDVSPIGSAAPYKNVRLHALINSDNGLLVTPAVGSDVLIAERTATDAAVVMYSEIDKIEFKIGDISFAADSEGIVFNEGVKNSFLTDINQLVNKLNAIESDINSIKQVFSTWAPVIQDGGASLKAAAASWAAQSLQSTGVADIKDDKIKH